MREQSDLSIGILRKSKAKVLEDGSEGSLLQDFEVALVNFELYYIEEGRLHILDVEGLLLYEKDEALFVGFLSLS